MSKYSLYNGVWYDGGEAGVIKFILSSDIDEATADLNKFLNINGYALEILKIDRQFSLSFSNILAMKEKGSDDDKRAVKYFQEIYFDERDTIEKGSLVNWL